MYRDLRMTCRGLSRSPAFTGAAVIMLAIGIAGATLIFALIQGVLLRPLPVHDPERLMVAWKELRTKGSARYPFGDREIQSVARASRLLEQVAGVTRNGVARSVLTDNGLASYANVALVTGGFFDVLRITPLHGRTLALADEQPGAEHVMVISSGLWHRRFGGSRDVIGRRVRVGEQPFTIVGVIPPDLDYPAGVEIWHTTSAVVSSDPFADAARREVNLIGRLQRGVSRQQAETELQALTDRLERDAPAHSLRGLVPVVRPFTEVVVGDVRSAMLALFAAVVLVLLIAIANVANLLLLRGEARRRELAVRTALGAGPWRLVRDALYESAVLAAVAGILGFAVAWWLLAPLVRLVPAGLPRVESIRIDTTVALFSFAVVFVAAAAAGIAPALASLRKDLVLRFRGDGCGILAASTTHGRRTLVVAQVALAVTVLAAAGLLIRSVLRLESVDLGLPADRLVLMELHVPSAKYGDSKRHALFLDATIARFVAHPAISSVTPVNVAPFSDQSWDLPRFIGEGQSAEQSAANPSLNLESIHPNYFETFQLPLVRGRAFTAADREGTTQVAIVSDDLAARIWSEQDPIGKRITMGDGRSPAAPSFTVVGIAASTRYRAVAGPTPTLYLPAAQFQMTATMLVVRTTASLELLASTARETMRSIDPDVRIIEMTTFGELLEHALARPRLNAFILAIFGAAALLLSMAGLYAVLAASVRHRHREIALRLALGATSSRIRRLILAEAIGLTGLGAMVGVAGAAAAARLVRHLLFELAPYDPLALIAAPLLVMVAAAVASYLPVRSATRVDPVSMLRG